MDTTRSALVAVLATLPVVSANLTAQGAESEGATISIPGLRKLEIGGQARLRFENRLDFDLNDNTVDDADFFLQRTRLDFGLEFTDDLSGFIQLQDFRRWGEETSTIDGTADGFDLHQGWVQMKNTPGIGGTSKIGRQAISLGDQRLIGALEWATQGRAFDGAVQTWQCDENYRLRAMYLQLADPGASSMYADAYLTGVYYTMLGIEDGEIDLYALLLNAEETAAGGNQNRLTLGGRWAQRFDGVAFGAEIATQTGEADGADIPFGETYAAHVHGTLDCDGPMWVRAEANAASGNDPNTSDNERFNTLFPTAHAHLGMMDLAFWENVLHLMVQVGYECCERNTLTASWHFFRSMEEGDVFRGPNATISAGGAGFSNTIGNEIDILFTRTFDTAPVKTSLHVGYGLFVPGAGAQDAAGADDLAHFVYVQGDLRF